MQATNSPISFFLFQCLSHETGKHSSSLNCSGWYVVLHRRFSFSYFDSVVFDSLCSFIPYSHLPSLLQCCSSYFTHHQFLFRVLSRLQLSEFPTNHFLIFIILISPSCQYYIHPFFFISLQFLFHIIFFLIPNSFRVWARSRGWNSWWHYTLRIRISLSFTKNNVCVQRVWKKISNSKIQMFDFH